MAGRDRRPRQVTQAQLAAHGLTPELAAEWVRHGWLTPQGEDFEATDVGESLLDALSTRRRRPTRRSLSDAPRAYRRRPRWAPAPEPPKAEPRERRSDRPYRAALIPDSWLPALQGLRCVEPEFQVRSLSFRGLEEHARRVLDERELDIVQRRGSGETLELIGARLGLTRERIRQLEGNAVRRMMSPPSDALERLLLQVMPDAAHPARLLNVDPTDAAWFGVAVELVRRKTRLTVLRRTERQYIVMREGWEDTARTALEPLPGRAYWSPADLVQAVEVPAATVPLLPVIVPEQLRLTACGMYAREDAPAVDQFVEVAQMLKWWGVETWHYSQLGRAAGDVRGEPTRWGARASSRHHAEAQARGDFEPADGQGMWRLTSRRRRKR